MLENNLKLDAIAWKAYMVGRTYGKFCISLSEDDKEQIYKEFEQFLDARKQEETERLMKAEELKKNGKFTSGSRHWSNWRK